MIKKPVRAMLSRMDTGKTIQFLSNPHTLEDEKTAEYEEPEVSGATAPPLRFKYGGSRQIKFECRFIAQGNVNDIAVQVEFIRSLALPVKPNNTPPKAFLAIGGFQMPIRIRNWKVTYNAWTPALKPKDLTVEVHATVDYGTPVPPAQPKPAAKTNKAKAKQNIKIQRITVR